MNWQFVKPTPKYQNKYHLSYKNEANLFPLVSKSTKDSFKIFTLENQENFWEFLLVDEDDDFLEIGLYLNIIQDSIKTNFFTIDLRINSLLNEEKWSILTFEFIQDFFINTLNLKNKFIEIQLEEKIYNFVKKSFIFKEISKQNEAILLHFYLEENYFFSDVHTHPFKEYYKEPKQELEFNYKNNIKAMLLVGTSWEDNQEIISYLDYVPNLFALVGIHPNNITNEDNFQLLEEIVAKNSKVAGIGEVGLDLYYDQSPSFELQLKCFIKQVKIAQKYNKTVMLHIRDNANDKNFFLFNTIKQVVSDFLDVKFVFHNFSANFEIYQYFAQLKNVFFSFSGVITYKKNQEARKILKHIDLEKIVLETDAPYLSPEPKRSLWPNHSFCIKQSFYLLSRIKEISLHSLTQQVKKNIEGIFNIKLYEDHSS
ncbi:TatD family hydrolase [Mesomycoplasma hyorhinis]|uniref:TatD family hydrolase n=1 Tax=Mesomycoplasma hyorhinis TaxID=2100 RepID=UPI001C05A630|nr:TatD family hydrolase [Mesomycoplasma hyorhinis]